jgi:hypothetical protein
MTDIQNRPCKSARDPCCYRTDDLLAKAIAALKARNKKN